MTHKVEEPQEMNPHLTKLLDWALEHIGVLIVSTVSVLVILWLISAVINARALPVAY